MDTLDTLSAPAILLKYKSYPPETVDLSPKETAILLNVSVRTLEKWRPERKHIPFTKTPGGIVYNLKTVLDYKNSLVINPVSDEVA